MNRAPTIFAPFAFFAVTLFISSLSFGCGFATLRTLRFCGKIIFR